MDTRYINGKPGHGRCPKCNGIPSINKAAEAAAQASEYHPLSEYDIETQARALCDAKKAVTAAYPILRDAVIVEVVEVLRSASACGCADFIVAEFLPLPRPRVH